jgi:hypothetical protein
MGSGANADDERFAAATIPNPLLFNLAADPQERENIIEKNPEKAAELAKELETIKSSPTTQTQPKS